jgi:transposase
MPVKGFLSALQQRELQKELKEHEHPEIRERILILLLLNDGKTQKEIANFLGCSLRKIAYWCVHGDPENLESLFDERMSGNYHKASEEYEFLPPYSPDYNIAELVWHSAKEFLAHRLFKSIEQLESLLHQLLNQGELIINWDRKLKNKGNSVNAI